MQRSLFGHLATRFSAHPENLATEALNYVLGRSNVARKAFVAYLEQVGVGLPDDLLFKTQVSEGAAIPDLVGATPGGKQPVVVESKFWAGLTENQPLGYLDLLPADQGGLALFIAPSQRLVTLWHELIRRCHLGGHAVAEHRQHGVELRAARIDERRILALASWRSVLSFMQRAVETEGQHEAVSDLIQLQGLCDHMDQEAFLPLRSEELSGSAGRRIQQFCQLVDDATEELVAAGLASTKGLRASAGAGWYGRYLLLQGNGCLLYFSAVRWDRSGATPLWLMVKDVRWKVSQALIESLASLEHEDPPRLFRDEGGSKLVVPLYLPTGVERAEVLQALVDQLREVAALLPTLDSAAPMDDDGGPPVEPAP